MKVRSFIVISIFFFISVIILLLNSWTALSFWPFAQSPAVISHAHKNIPNNPLTIFMVTNNYYPYNGGIVSAIESSTQELRKQGHRVYIITLDFLGTPKADDIHASKETDVIRLYCPIKFIYKTNHMALPLHATSDIKKLIVALKPDIIHVYHPFLLGVCALRAAQAYTIPIVFTYYTLYEQYAHYVPLPEFLTKPSIRLLAHSFCNQVKNVIAPSQSLAHYLTTQNSIASVVIPGGLLPIFERESFAYKPESAVFQLMSVSRFAKEKNIYFLLDMYKQLDQARFKLMLIGYGAEEKKLRDYAYNTLGLSPENLVFVIKPTKQTLVELYDKADLFVFASTTETQGFVLAEALARGTPVIALRGPGVVDIVKDTVNGYIIENQQDMIKAIQRVSKNKKLHKTLQYQAWLTGKEYSIALCTTKLLRYYDTVIKNHTMKTN